MNENGIWERQQGEGDQAWQAFLAYLHGNRSCEKVAKELQKTPQHIRRLAARFDWRERARQYDNAALKAAQAELKHRLALTFTERWRQLDELANLAIDQLRTKIQQASPRVLNEIITSSIERQLAMTDKLKILDEADADDKNLTITIVAATDEDRPKS